MTPFLEINLFGACIVRSADHESYEITGAKHRALFALLATAPFGRRTRGFLQDTLWGTSCFDSGRQSLRRALSDIKAIMGEDFARVLNVNNSEIALNLDVVTFLGRPGSGEFLEGIDIRDNEFNEWLRGIRLQPEQIYSLFSPARQSPPPSMLPAIAILPFRLVQGEPVHQVLSDWLAEEICRSLSRSNLLAVISHLSARRIAQRVFDLQNVHDSLGVDYCVTGSLHVSGEVATLDADCIDTRNGRILWTRQFRESVGAFLSVDSQPVADVVRAIGQTIATEAVRFVRGRSFTDLEDHHLLLAGVGMMHHLSLKSFARSRELIEEALRRAPRAAETYAWLAEWYLMSVFNGWSVDPARDTMQARDYAARALDIEPENSFCLTIDGAVHNNLLMRLDDASGLFDAALHQNPNEAMAWLLSGVLSAYRDQGEDAVLRIERARLRSPIDPFSYFFDSLSATAYLSAGDYHRALDLSDRSLALNDRHLSTFRVKISALYGLDRMHEARTCAEAMMRRHPYFSLESYRKTHPAAEYRIGQTVIAALEASGVG